MQLLYGGSNHLTASVFSMLEKKIPEAVDLAIREEFSGSDVLEGKNILLRHVIIELVQRILHIDKEDLPITVQFLEEKFFRPLQIADHKTVLLYGIIDRVDESAGATRIIDYKTGKVEGGNPENMEQLFLDPKFKEQFQTYFYSYLYWKHSAGKPLKAGILAIKNLSGGIHYINKGDVISPGQFNEFEQHLVKLIAEIMDPVKNFHQTPDADRCKYCPYKEICER
jgi:RecB family exonuclease